MEPGNPSLQTAAPTRPGAPPPPPARRMQPVPSSASGRISPSSAAVARPFLVLLPVLAFLLPALLVAFSRAPVYTAEARLLVGGFDVEAQAVPGFVEAARTLAATYARLVNTPAIADPVAAQLDLAPGGVAGGISATAVPESSIIAVQGASEDEDQALRLADVAAEELVNYASGTTSEDERAELLQDFRDAAGLQSTAQFERDRLAAAYDTNPTDTIRAQLASAEADVVTATLTADNEKTRYQEAIANAGRSNVALVAPAAATGDDRRSNIQVAVAASVGLGLIAGVALATFVVNRGVTRAPGNRPGRRSPEA